MKSSKQSRKFSTADPLLEIDLDVFGEVHPAKMDIGPDRKLYFTGGTDSRAYRGDIEGNFEVFAEITTGAGFTLGCQFDSEGNHYMVNGAGVYMVPEASSWTRMPPSPSSQRCSIHGPLGLQFL